MNDSNNLPAPHISVIIAAHNEAAAIGGVVRGVRRALETIDVGTSEVRVIDDGSVDTTAAQAREAGALVTTLWPNRGKGVALREGIALSRGRWLVFIDGDGQDDPADLPKLLAAAVPGVAMVSGSRFLGTLHRGAISRPNLLGNLAMTGVLDLLFGVAITDSQAGFRVVDGDIARALRLQASEYEIETELLARLLRRGERVIEVPVNRYVRTGGVTDFRRIRNGLRILTTILRERVRPLDL